MEYEFRMALRQGTTTQSPKLQVRMRSQHGFGVGPWSPWFGVPLVVVSDQEFSA